MISPSQPMNETEIRARLAELKAAQEAATGWGAAVGARHEEIKGLESRLAAMASPSQPTILSQEDFCARFKAHMIKHAGFETFDDGGSVAEYADGTAQTYWEDQHLSGESPEECAESDMSYWGEG